MEALVSGTKTAGETGPQAPMRKVHGDGKGRGAGVGRKGESLGKGTVAWVRRSRLRGKARRSNEDRPGAGKASKGKMMEEGTLLGVLIQMAESDGSWQH